MIVSRPRSPNNQADVMEKGMVALEIYRKCALGGNFLHVNIYNQNGENIGSIKSGSTTVITVDKTAHLIFTHKGYPWSSQLNVEECFADCPPLCKRVSLVVDLTSKGPRMMSRHNEKLIGSNHISWPKLFCFIIITVLSISHFLITYARARDLSRES